MVRRHVDRSNWILSTEYVHGVGIDNVLTIERDSTTWYYHHDALGSVTELTDSNGDLVQAYEYDAWGNVTIYNPDDTTILNPYMYTGRRWDPEISLYYYRARYYNPQLGRFIQPDVAGYVDGSNLYLYVGDSPLRFLDPSGLKKTWNTCCPELLECLSAIMADLYATEESLNSALRDLAFTIDYATAVQLAYANAMRQIAETPNWKLALDPRPLIAVGTAVLRTREISGILTTHVLSKKGVQGFRALSPFSKFMLKATVRVSIYTLIASWASDLYLKTETIRLRAKTLDYLSESTAFLSSTLSKTERYYTDTVDTFNFVAEQYAEFDGLEWEDSHASLCDENVRCCEAAKTRIEPMTAWYRKWAEAAAESAETVKRGVNTIVGWGAEGK